MSSAASGHMRSLPACAALRELQQGTCSDGDSESALGFVPRPGRCHPGWFRRKPSKQTRKRWRIFILLQDLANGGINLAFCLPRIWKAWTLLVPGTLPAEYEFSFCPCGCYITWEERGNPSRSALGAAASAGHHVFAGLRGSVNLTSHQRCRQLPGVQRGPETLSISFAIACSFHISWKSVMPFLIIVFLAILMLSYAHNLLY